MRTLLVRNERSGSADAADPEAELRERGCDVVCVDLRSALRWGDDPPERMRRMERVVVAGGDGSVGPAALVAGALGVPLAIVPLGTANDAARALGVPSAPGAALELAAHGTVTRAIDVCTLGSRPFVNVASLGASESASRTAAPLKRWFGPLAYPLGAIAGGMRSRPVRCTAVIDGEQVWSGAAAQVLLAGTGTFGGVGSTGGTVSGDGNVDLLVVPAERGITRAAGDAAALLVGELATREGVVHARGPEIHLHLAHRRHVVVDGERVRAQRRDLVARVAHHGVPVVVG